MSPDLNIYCLSFLRGFFQVREKPHLVLAKEICVYES